MRVSHFKGCLGDLLEFGGAGGWNHLLQVVGPVAYGLCVLGTLCRIPNLSFASVGLIEAALASEPRSEAAPVVEVAPA